MVMKRYVTGCALAAMLAATAGCDRLNEAGKLASDALSQLTGGSQESQVLVLTDDQILAAASVDDRALFGPMQAPVALAPINVDEMLQTQRFYAVGSVIAMPKVEITQPVLEPESFSLIEEPTDASQAASAMNTNDAPLPESLEVPAGPPPALEAPAATAQAPESNRVTQDGAPAILKPGAIVGRPQIKLPTAGELRQQAQVAAPKALKEAMRDTGIDLKPETLRTARKAAEDTFKANTQTAQALGDAVTRKMADATAPIPKALQVRARLDVDTAIAARDKAGRQLEKLGLSGIVTPGEGGQMRITIGVNPTQFREGKLDFQKVATMRSLFAPQRADAAEECAGTPDMEKIKADPVLATECVVKVLRESGEYQYVEKDFIFNNQMMKKPTPQPATVSTTRPNDPLFSLQWNFRDLGAAAGQSNGGAGFSGFWARTKDTGSRDVVVAVVDTGIQMNHPDIKGSPNLAPGFDMVSDPIMGNDGDGRDSDPNDPGDKCDPNDATVFDSFHGTHVAGTIGVASTNNAAGVAGGAWNVTIVPVRALGRCGGKLSDINDGIRWAAGTVPARDLQGKEIWNSKPADIINLSIGLFGPCPASMQAAINDAVAAGAIVVSAAGNARVDTQYFAPGGCQNVISVAANDARGVLTPYSNFGANVAIMAPGGDMSRDDDKDGRPDGILSTKYSKNCSDPVNPSQKIAQCYYSYENGTSMAAPHVSAALALLKTKFPSAVPSELKTRLLTATTPRTNLQCSGACSAYPGSTPIPGSADMCYRPCGGKMLNLSNAQLQ
jgi:serine protease